MCDSDLKRRLVIIQTEMTKHSDLVQELAGIIFNPTVQTIKVQVKALDQKTTMLGISHATCQTRKPQNIEQSMTTYLKSPSDNVGKDDVIKNHMISDHRILLTGQL